MITLRPIEHIAHVSRASLTEGAGEASVRDGVVSCPLRGNAAEALGNILLLAEHAGIDTDNYVVAVQKKQFILKPAKTQKP